MRYRSKSKKWWLSLLLIFLILINLSFRFAEARNNAEEPNRSVFASRCRRVVSNTKGLKPVAHKELLDILEQEGKQDTNDLVNRFRQFPKEQKLETAAYCLKENKHVSQILLKICSEEPLHDKCLVPYIAEIMPKLKDNDLRLAVRSASIIPDVNLVEPLINYAAKSNYHGSFVAGSGMYSEIVEWSVFKEAALAISRITDGRMGRYNIAKSKETVIHEWREAWPQVKKDMQDEIEEKRKAIQPVAHLELIALLAEAEAAGLEKRDEFAEKFKKYELSQKLEALAYAIEKGLYLDLIPNIIADDDDLQKDKRLVPFLSQAIKVTKGEKLLLLVLIVAEMPDSSFLPLLMKYTLENDYVKSFNVGSESNNLYYVSVFGTSSRAIYKMTRGEIGSIQYITTRKEVPEEEKKTQIEKWRKIYEETLKQGYEPSSLVLSDNPPEPNN